MTSASKEAAAIDDREFAALMAVLGPFEQKPRIASACSGGADSMALTLLLHRWSDAIGGSVKALVVDHRLRPESVDEAKVAISRLERLGIPNRLLARPNEPLDGNLQAAARRDRYRLLSEWCVRNEVLHLAMAHHLGDQAETLLLRLARGSGVDGLAAMPRIRESAAVRVLRPLLDITRDRLEATLRAAGIDHVEDPSNRDETFQRVRLRRAQAILAQEGLTPERLCETAMRAGRARAALQDATDRLLARTVRLYPEGYCLLDPPPITDAPPDVALRALSRVLIAVAGSDYPPRHERLRRLFAEILREGGIADSRTLHGCRLLRSKDRVLICREPRAAAESIPAEAGRLWDGRFRVSLPPGKLFLPSDKPFQLRRLGRNGWIAVLKDRPELRQTRVPGPVRPSLPALWDLDGIACVPHLGYVRSDVEAARSSEVRMIFAPAAPLSTSGFADGGTPAGA